MVNESMQGMAIYGQDQKAPKEWKKFLGSGSNKESLRELIASHWETIELGLVVTCTCDIPELASNREELDTGCFSMLIKIAGESTSLHSRSFTRH